MPWFLVSVLFINPYFVGCFIWSLALSMWSISDWGRQNFEFSNSISSHLKVFSSCKYNRVICFAACASALLGGATHYSQSWYSMLGEQYYSLKVVLMCKMSVAFLVVGLPQSLLKQWYSIITNVALSAFLFITGVRGFPSIEEILSFFTGATGRIWWSAITVLWPREYFSSVPYLHTPPDMTCCVWNIL